jgi:hypothetical protein
LGEFSGGARGREASGSFLKKRTKKLLSVCTRARWPGTHASQKSLFASFSSEKEEILLEPQM